MAVNYEWEIARDNMKQLRIKAGMKQSELGAEFNVSGPAIHLYESGKIIPRISYVEMFCMFFGIGIDDLYESDLVEGVLHL